MINLETKTQIEEILKKYLEENASEVLTEKINNGVTIQKDNKTLVNKKTLTGFLSYANGEARKLAKQGATSACVEDKVVFGWLMHYFEEETIEEKLYNLDGTEYKKEVSKPKTKASTSPTSSNISKPTESVKPQLSLFDLLNYNTDTSLKTPDKAVKQEDIKVETDKSGTDTDIIKETEPQNIEAESVEIMEENEEEKHWIDEHTYVDNNGVVHELEPEETDIKLEILSKLKSLIGEQIIVR